ncbi:hypothetical protein Tco_0967705 [Tanacetum coccineum]
MCDKKNYVLFTDTECLVLSPNFKLPDESQILLKIPRKDNMYSFDMKNIVPKESLTCLLVKDNLVRGLPTKRFENNQTCVACLKGKQHRASCKSKVLNPITKPLFMLHMDLFGPTFVSSLMHKKYCLVVTDDYSRIHSGWLSVSSGGARVPTGSFTGSYWLTPSYWYNAVGSWRLFPFSNVHVLETISGKVVYMFADGSYPLSVQLMKKMLKHKLEIEIDGVGNDMTYAEQLIQFIKNQIAASIPSA